MIGGLEPPERPATIHASGYVFATDKDSDSFLVTVWPKIHGILPLSPLTIRAMMRVKDSFTRLSQPLPRVNTMIGFSAQVLGFKDGILFVAVYSHSYFSPDSDDSDEFIEDDEDLE
jgi:hypothetical protein